MEVYWNPTGTCWGGLSTIYYGVDTTQQCRSTGLIGRWTPNNFISENVLFGWKHNQRTGSCMYTYKFCLRVFQQTHQGKVYKTVIQAMFLLVFALLWSKGVCCHLHADQGLLWTSLNIHTLRRYITLKI